MHRRRVVVSRHSFSILIFCAFSARMSSPDQLRCSMVMRTLLACRRLENTCKSVQESFMPAPSTFLPRLMPALASLLLALS